MPELIEQLGSAIVLGLFLVGLAAQLLGSVLNRPVLRRAGVLSVAGALGFGLPLLGGLVMVTVALTLLPNPASFLLLGLAVILFAVMLVVWPALWRLPRDNARMGK